MSKQVLKYADIRERIIRGVDKIADPVRGTISPKGRNVIFLNDKMDYIATNDGVTIAKEIASDDEVENAIISIIKGSSLKTNSEAGDGTSTSILLSQVLIKEGLKLVDNGMNPMDVKHGLELYGEELIKKLKKSAVKIRNDKDLENVARISSNSDDEIAKDVLKVLKVTGLDGMVFLEPNTKPKTEIEEETGFPVDFGLYAPELRNNPRAYSAAYKNVPVLITDKKIYYKEEAETIFKTVLQAGHKQVVIVAKDFIGQAPNYFIANHAQDVCKVLLVKDPRATDKDTNSLYDLATYLGGKVITEKTGSLVNKLTIADFVMADKVFADGAKTLITTKKKKNRDLTDLIALLKKDNEKKETEDTKRRIASLTNGMVTIKVGGSTPIETIERLYRYEDAVQACRAAMRDGFLVGGGLSLFHAGRTLKVDDEFRMLFRKFTEASVRQIAENCGEHADTIIAAMVSGKGIGYNAKSGLMEDLAKAGVIDPYKVTEMAVRNSVSVASQIISSNFLIIPKEEEIKKND